MYDTADIISPAVAEGKSTIVLIQNGLGKLSVPFFSTYLLLDQTSLTFF